MNTRPEFWTVGHWTWPEAEFLALLASADIDLVVDVRRLPGSRRNPHFNADAMKDWLAAAGIGYRQLPELAGRRGKDPNRDERNAGWQNASFRNYADYTRTADYERGIDELCALAKTHRVAILCGEPMPWRCHRLLISNTLAAKGFSVHHLTGTGTGTQVREHTLGEWGAAPALAESGELSYPAD